MRLRRPLAPLTLPDQSGRTWVVTGATNGIGRETARAAAAAGARVVITARDAQRGEQARRDVGADAVVLLDLASLDSVREAAAATAALTGDDGIDVLVNNAGTIVPSRRETVDGHELMLATNLLGPFAYTNLLAPLLRERVTVVGSEAHRYITLDREDMQWRRRRWRAFGAYASSKLGDMLWGLELSRRLAGRSVTVTLSDPGWAATNLSSASGHDRVDRAFAAVSAPIAQSSEEGAQPSLFAATADIPTGSYVGTSGFHRLWGPPALLGRTAEASSPENARWVWEMAARETGTDLG